MKNKIIKSIILVFLFVLLLSAVYAYSLPDLKPVLNFQASGKGTTAILTSVAVDSLTNAGISRIEIYQDNALFESKDCEKEKTCTFTKVIFENEKTSHSFYAKAIDISGKTAQSEAVQINFEGIAEAIDIPPVIYENSYEQRVVDANYTWSISDENTEITRGRNITFSVGVKDLDDENLDYKWYISGPLAGLGAQSISGPVAEGISTFSRVFDKEGDYTVTIVASDGKKETSKEWGVSVKNATIQGTIYDIDTGLPVSGARIYFYDASVYDPELDSGDYSALEPKEIPDTVTDSNGNYNLYLPVVGPLASIYNMVVQGSDEKDFSIYVEKDKEKKHDVYLDENRDVPPVTRFNAEGHIAYSGKYEGSNRYTLGDIVDFFMFGVNNGETNETITFEVQDHTSTGNPNEGPIVYTGSISNPSESLTVNAGEKKHARFSFQLPSGLDSGRYDIHILWDNETWHHIGNFFIVEDITPPEVWFDPETYVCRPEASCPVLAGQESSFLYHTVDTAQEGTMNHIQMYIENITTNLEVSIKDNAGNAINSSGVYGQVRVVNFEGAQFNITNSTGWLKDGHIKINYTESGYYTLTIQVADKAGNTANASINVTVHANEAQVNSIGDAIYSLFGLVDFPMKHDFNYTVEASSPDVSTVWDRFNNDESYGDEYMTENDLDITDVGALETVNYGKSGPEYAKPIYPMTEDEYNYTLSSFFTLIKCVPRTEPIGGSCSARNFAPEISSCNPGDGYYYYPCIPVDVAMSNSSSKQFNIGAVDPNNDAFSTYWYLDNTLVQTNSTSYTLVGNASLIGNHTVKAVALDWSGENISINKQGYGPHNSAEWKVVIN